MHMDFGLKQELHQKLVMTPQLCQAIAILQLSSMELAEMVEKELLDNPVLELSEPAEAKPVEAEAQGETPAVTAEEVDRYLDWAEYFDGPNYKEYTPVEKSEQTTFEALVSNSITLQEHLEFQLHMAVLSSIPRLAGEYLVGCIDANGYLRVTVEEAAEALDEPLEMVAAVLELIQTFDPPGVGARNLRECLLIQAKQQGVTDPIVYAVIENYLDDIAAGKLKNIADKLDCTPRAVQHAMDMIRTFDPKPGCSFGGGQSQYVIPDITVEKVNGNYVVIINDNDTPNLTINPYYRHVVREADTEAKKYVEGRIQAAVWLIKSIEQRRRTLYNVMEAIVLMQKDFFDNGPNYLAPLTMKKVADQVGIHESTVSRATANKYVQTPHGLFSLRTFFTAAVQNADGPDVAAGRIKRELKEMITKEDPSQPYSDQALTDIFADRGVTVSRRTVAKYREELGIAASSKRKRY